jgi:predicted HAD superfamily hydrolase
VYFVSLQIKKVEHQMDIRKNVLCDVMPLEVKCYLHAELSINKSVLVKFSGTSLSVEAKKNVLFLKCWPPG